MYIDGANNFAASHSSSNNGDDESSHLPLSALFSQSDRYKCLVGGCKKKEKKQEKVYYGPRFQQIHLALPRREYTETGYVENITCNNRVMSVKTLSKTPQIFEITNFLSDNETELIIDMVKAKGMKKPPLRNMTVQLPDEINQHTFDGWDEDFDGHLSINEIRQITELNPYLLTEDDVVDLIKSIDKDENNYLSFGELFEGGLQEFKNNLNAREQVRNNFKIKNVEEAWLWHDEDELLAYEDLLEDYHERVKTVTGIPSELSEQTEPIQVRKHEEGAFTACQQDSMGVDSTPCCVYGGKNCRMCRYATIMIFLNDVEEGGELVFPLAQNDTFSWHNLKEDTIKKCEKFPKISHSNIIVKPERGKAVMWYNHLISPSSGWMGQMDPQSIAGSAPVTRGVQWTAKMWLNIIGDGVNELRPWKMGANWLSKNNKNNEIVEELRNDYFREGEPYVHEHKTTYNHAISQKLLKSQTQTEILKPNVKVESESVLVEQNTNDQPDVVTENEKLATPAPSSEPVDHEIEQSSITEDVQADIVTPPEVGVEIVNPDPVVGINTTESKPEEERRTFPKSDTVPLGPPKRPLDPTQPFGGKVIDNRLVRASLLLLEELDRDELETIARSLHEKLHLACIPLIVTPFG